MQKFTVRFLLFSAALLVVAALLLATVLKQWYLPVFPWLFGFLVIETLGIHYILIGAAENKRAAIFNNYYLLSTMGKMFLNLIFIGIYIYIDKINAIPFAAAFLALYFIFTAFEVPSILSQINKVK